MSLSRARWSELKAELDSLQFRPSRRLGQNFLLDDGACGAIVASAGLDEGERVLEVGVGLGFLTAHLLEAGARVLGVEIDARLASVARRRLPADAEFELLQTDVLAGKHALAPELLERLSGEQRWSLVANLPYAVGSPVVVLLSRLPNPPRRMTVLVQLEVAERLCAAPGESSWGPLTARLAPLYSGRFVRRVGPGAFKPRPKVDSAVVQLELRDERPPRASLPAYDALVGRLFQERRKRARTPLSRVAGGAAEADALLAELGIEPEARVDALTPVELLALSDALGDQALGGAARAGPDGTTS